MTRKIKVDGAKGGGKGNGKNSTTDSGGVYAASVLSPASAALSITIDAEGGADTLAPVLQSFSSTTADGVYGPAAVVTIVASFDEAIAAGSSLTVVLDNDDGTSVLLSTIAGPTVSGTYVVGATGSGQDSADLTVASISAMSVSDVASNEQTSTSLPPSNLGDTSDIVIDTTAPRGAAPWPCGRGPEASSGPSCSCA